MNLRKVAISIIIFCSTAICIVGVIGVLRYIKQSSQTAPVFSSPTPVTEPSNAKNSSQVATSPNGTETQLAPSASNSSVTVNVPADLSTLNLFRQVTYDANFKPISTQPMSGVVYKDDGIINSGKFTGYHRLFAISPIPEGIGGDYASFVFATKDYSSFIVDRQSYDSTEDPNAPDSYFEPGKIVGVDDIPLNQPETIDLSTFTLVRNNLYTTGDQGQEFGNIDSKEDAPLKSAVPGLQIFSFVGNTPVGYGGNDPYSLVAPYTNGINDVEVQDQFGVTYDYWVMPTLALGAKNEQDYPQFFSSADFTTPVSAYNSYGELIPNPCGATNATDVLQNITSNDLTTLTTTKEGIEIYTLKDKNHPLNKAEYQTKVTGVGADFSALNNMSPPSYDEYVSKNPVLIFKDPWDRWVAVGELDYQLEGGCGKPVIYLYPSKPTAVTVALVHQVKFTTDIPTYVGQWRVLASPNGALQDLQPDKTNCADFDNPAFGSEYAKTACERENYPYLYWSGRIVGQYPTQDHGWIVAQSDVADFLNQKLSELGLSDQERQDMTSYWVPELLNKDAPYYRIAFIQTAQMDQFIPLKVTPSPDTVLRVFLDWSPLFSKPSSDPEPEQLDHLNRKGFTLVEWGGLKQ